MGAKESTNTQPEEEVHRWTREEIEKAFEVKIETGEDGKQIVKSQLLDLIRGPKKTKGTEFSWASIYADDDPAKKDGVARALDETPFRNGCEDRGFGAIFGMAVADAMGARVEFSPLDYEASDLKGMGSGRGGKFMLEAGQWTDDTSLGLCVADSLLTKGCFDAHDMMHRFLAWWFCGYNNAFRFEESEKFHTSCGLGRMMKASFMEYIEEPAVETVSGTKESCGNGSIMRLAPVPVFYRLDIEEAEKCAAQQSLLTHQGTEAAECCRLMAHIMVRGIAGENLHDVLESLGTSFKTTCPGVIALSRSEAERLEPESKSQKTESETTKAVTEQKTDVSDDEKKDEVPEKDVIPKEETEKKDDAPEDVEKKEEPEKEAVSEEPPIDPDRNWNWKADDFKYSPLRARLSPGYIGSYAMDGLAMALHILWSTTSFSEAVLKAVNLRGDADTVGAVVGQIAGSFYGCSQIPLEWKKTVMKWDNHEIALRALRLVDHFPLED